MKIKRGSGVTVRRSFIHIRKAEWRYCGRLPDPTDPIDFKYHRMHFLVTQLLKQKANYYMQLSAANVYIDTNVFLREDVNGKLLVVGQRLFQLTSYQWRRKLARLGDARGRRGNGGARRDNGRSDGGLRGLRSLGGSGSCGSGILARTGDNKLEM